MKTDIRTIVGGTLFILLFAIVSNVIIESSSVDAQSSYGSWACTTEVQICPDGSVVGRTPPYCKFASCTN